MNDIHVRFPFAIIPFTQAFCMEDENIVCTAIIKTRPTKTGTRKRNQVRDLGSLEYLLIHLLHFGLIAIV